ncbi:MAG: TerC family protein [cyanobacterium endosymbiont of Rhopalodia sterrenbergii]
MLDQVVDSSLIFSLKTILIFLVIVILEAVLSADNAIALAAIAQGLPNLKSRKYALNLGLVFAYILRMALILTATWVINFWQFELLGALYLLWLAFNHFTFQQQEGHHHSLQSQSLWQAIPSIAITDLAFSLDSVTTAIAIADDIWLILLGGTVGVITLRFLAELFIHWLEEYTHLEDAGFITVGLVGVKLLIRVINTDFVPPEWLMISTIALIFLWGFSKRSSETIEPHKVAIKDLEINEHEEREKISS